MAIHMLQVYLEKLLKPVFECLKQEIQLSVKFFNDSYLPTYSELECQKNVNATVGLLCKLDFVIRSDNSVLKLTQKI